MYLFCELGVDVDCEGLSVKRTDFEILREVAAEKSGDKDGSLGEVMLDGSSG